MVLVLLVAPCSALTVSSINLKWIEQNVNTPTTHEIFISENTASAAVVFYGDAEGLCSAEPQTLTGNGSIVMTCNPPASSAIGYARVSEISDGAGMVATGIRLPIELSASSTPAAEMQPEQTRPPAPDPEQSIAPEPSPAFTFAQQGAITPEPAQTPAEPHITITDPLNTPIGVSISLIQIVSVLLVGFILVLGVALGVRFESKREKP